MTDHRTDDLDPTPVPPVDASGIPVDPDQIDAPQSAPMDDAAGGPTAEPKDAPVDEEQQRSEDVATELGDFA